MIHYRRIKEGEWELFRDLRLRALLDSPIAFMSTYDSALLRTAESWKEQVIASASGKDRYTYLAFSDTETVGIAALYRNGNEASFSGEVLQVWVDPAYRGNGVATELLNYLIQWAKQQAFKDIIATIHVENAEVQAFYEMLGFVFDQEETERQPPRDLVLRLTLD